MNMPNLSEMGESTLEMDQSTLERAMAGSGLTPEFLADAAMSDKDGTEK